MDICYNINIFYKKLTNIDTQISHEGLFIHSGFFNQVNSVKEEIFQIIDTYNNYNLHLTGHSLGGANATILTYLVSEKYENKTINLVTFGSPMVGNIVWKTCFNNKKNIIYYRITNKYDIITVVPPIYYFHVGKHISLDNNEIKYVDDNDNSQNIFWLFLTTFYKYNFKDHLPTLYYTRIIENKNKFEEMDNAIIF